MMLNILFMTADDLNWDSVGAYGCQTPEITPNIDLLASEGIRFEYAHVTIAVCQPSRGVLATGRYPHRNGIEGFYHTDLEIATLPDCLREAGYVCGILGKYDHSTPRLDFAWDMSKDQPDLGQGRDPALYYQYARSFFEEAQRQGRPFYLMANSHDPHRPFSGSDQEREEWPNEQITPPSRTYRPEDVQVPGFLPDLPEVRREVAEYYSSARRCDDTVGVLLRALEETGQADNTLVIFLSDNGMAFPFAKTNCYLHSTKTPWIMRLPGVIQPGGVDAKHFISGIDLMPTILDLLKLPLPDNLDGTSFLPVLKGDAQQGREHVCTQFHETARYNRYPMRCIQNKHYGYIFNAWSNGTRVFKNESQEGRTFKAMQAASAADQSVADRVKLFQYRVVEELYDFEKDPDALHNLIHSPEHHVVAEQMRSDLETWMRSTNDPCLQAFLNRESAGERE
ncbi:MAG: sulfatase, partial [Lentisphaerae bacterium]|nr:sulfatase [Lentisphaerota bacterium]